MGEANFLAPVDFSFGEGWPLHGAHTAVRSAALLGAATLRSLRLAVASSIAAMRCQRKAAQRVFGTAVVAGSAFLGGRHWLACLAVSFSVAFGGAYAFRAVGGCEGLLLCCEGPRKQHIHQCQ